MMLRREFLAGVTGVGVLSPVLAAGSPSRAVVAEAADSQIWVRPIVKIGYQYGHTGQDTVLAFLVHDGLCFSAFAGDGFDEFEARVPDNWPHEFPRVYEATRFNFNKDELWHVERLMDQDFCDWSFFYSPDSLISWIDCVSQIDLLVSLGFRVARFYKAPLCQIGRPTLESLRSGQ